MTIIKKNKLDVRRQNFDLDCWIEVGVSFDFQESIEGIIQNMQKVKLEFLYIL
jgi:hypothetical protein